MVAQPGQLADEEPGEAAAGKAAGGRKRKAPAAAAAAAAAGQQAGAKRRKSDAAAAGAGPGSSEAKGRPRAKGKPRAKKRAPESESGPESESEEPEEALPQPQEREEPRLARRQGPPLPQEVKEELWAQALQRADDRVPQSLESVELMMDIALAREFSKRVAKEEGRPWAERPPWPSDRKRLKDYGIGARLRRAAPAAGCGGLGRLLLEALAGAPAPARRACGCSGACCGLPRRAPSRARAALACPASHTRRASGAGSWRRRPQPHSS
jgi:hypothetical protein